MEDIADAIEDAQYVRAVDDGPRPEIPWAFPSEEELEKWKEGTLKKWENDVNVKDLPKPFSYEWILSAPLSFFLFSEYIKVATEDYCMINFVEEVLRWRKLRSRHRRKRAKEIIYHYLAKIRTNKETGEKMLPEKTEINEFDLERQTQPDEFQTKEITQLADENIDETCAKCCVGLDGPVRDAFLALVPLLNQSARRFSDPGTLSNTEESSKQNSHHTNLMMNGNQPLNHSSNENFEAVEVRTSTVQTTNLPEDLFDDTEKVVLELIRRKHWDKFKSNSEQWNKLMNFLWYQDRPVVHDDFNPMRVLGRGGFGLVSACKKAVSGKLYAMKEMNKKRIKIKRSEQLTLSERAALSALNSPFVVNLKYSFQTKDQIFLILDLMTGGDLSFHLTQKGRFNKEECLYYASRIALGLQALHDNNYAYRDLKPENCLLAEDGRVKLTDLGLAVQITPTLQGAAGTRGYWAPEMLRRDANGRRTRYNHMVDWFSFGCMVAEFISGKNPFRTDTAVNFGFAKGASSKDKAMDQATLEMDPELKPKYFNDPATDFCKRLLDKNPETRLGSRGIEEIMEHDWFDCYNWEMIINDKFNPPFIPAKDVNAASQSDIGTFAENKSFNETVLDENDERVYANWEWTNPKAFAAEVIEFLIYERETGQPLLPPTHGSGCCCSIL